MGMHEIAIGGAYVSPLFIFGLIALPITKIIMLLIHRANLSRWIWHEMLFICAVYLLVLCILTITIGIFF